MANGTGLAAYEADGAGVTAYGASRPRGGFSVTGISSEFLGDAGPFFLEARGITSVGFLQRVH